MTTYSDNLRIPHLDQNVAQPEIPENTAKNIIDNILSNVYQYSPDATDVSNGYVEITHSDSVVGATNWQSFMIEILEGVDMTTNFEVRLPINPRPYIFKNSTSYTITFKTITGAGFPLASGSNAYGFSDGANIEKLEFSASGDGTTLESLNDTPSGYGTATSVLLSNGADSFAFYDISNKLDKTGGTISDYGETAQTPTSLTNTLTVDLANGNVINYTAIENTVLTLTTSHTNTSFTMLATNLGAFTFDWDTNQTVKWEGGTEPTWSTTGDDLVTFTKIGSVWVGGALIGVA
ncbi:MAG: hypothetical protein GY707_05235 [Desulfobacteraceae bacterium]|nr:hypothetical protein [Desulfobacteraceae bacterium]